MELNINFDKSLEKIINTCPPLADWFDRNQDTMAYYDLKHPGCTHFENSHANPDLVALGRMANAALTCLASKLPISQEEKARFAAFSIATVYDGEELNLSENARIQYYLDIESLQKENNVSRSQ